MTESQLSEKKNSWWAELRQMLSGHVLTIILTPLTVGVTIYLTEFYKSPKPKIEFVTCLVDSMSELNSPPDSIRFQVIKDPYLAEMIWKEPILMNSKAAKDWLNGFGEWNSECETTFETLIAVFRKKIRPGEILQWNEKIVTQNEPYVAKEGFWTTEPYTENVYNFSSQRSESVTKYRNVYHAPEHSVATWQIKAFESQEPANKVLGILGNFFSQIERVKKAPTIRTGKVDFRVGVLNKGGSDGVIYRDAVLKFEKGEMYVTAQTYTGIGAHSFTEVLFSSGVSFSGGSEATKLVDDTAVKASFAQLVQENKPIPFQLTLTLSDKKSTVSGVIPANPR